MPKKTLKELQNSGIITIYNKDKEKIEKLVSPNHIQVGVDSDRLKSSLSVKGVVYADCGLSGSLTKLVNGTSYLVAGDNVTITSQSNGQVTISSNGGSASPGGSDTYVQFNDGGSFGGDSGLVFNKTTNTLTTDSLSGSLTQLSNGTSYLVAGSNVQIVTSSNGQVTISSTLSGSSGIVNGRDKVSYFVTSSHTAFVPLVSTNTDFSAVAYQPDYIDVLLDGRLVHSGTSAQVIAGDRDYYIDSLNSMVFGFELDPDQIVDTVVSNVGSSSGNGDSSAEYLVLSNTGSLSNERQLVISTGLTSSDAGSNSTFTIKVEKEMVFNEKPSGEPSGYNTYFELANSVFSSNEIFISVDGSIQTPPGKTTYQDYSVTGSDIYFTTGSTPSSGSIILATYYKAVS